MAKIYVAGNDLNRATSVMDMLRQAGHTITFDWVPGINDETEASKVERALIEREAVRQADVLVYLWAPNQESARFEVGMAMGLGKKIVVSSDHKAFFFTLPEVTCVASDEEILKAL